MKTQLPPCNADVHAAAVILGLLLWMLTIINSHAMRPDQERIAEWLSERAPDLAEVYRGAIRLLDDPDFLGRRNFICHAARDISNRAPDIITDSKTERVEMTDDLQALVELWLNSGIDSTAISTIAGEKDADITAASAEVSIPYLLFKRVHIIVALQQKVMSNRNRAIMMVETVAPENSGRREVLVPLARQWVKVADWFQQHTHAGINPQVVAETDLQNTFRALETFLDTMIGEFFGPMDTLDEILDNANS
jgi:hypothetical protein